MAVSQEELLLVLDLRVQGLAGSIVDLDTESPREPEANVVPRVDFLLHNELCELGQLRTWLAKDERRWERCVCVCVVATVVQGMWIHETSGKAARTKPEHTLTFTLYTSNLPRIRMESLQ